MRRCRLCGQHALCRVSIDERIGLEMGGDDVRIPAVFFRPNIVGY